MVSQVRFLEERASEVEERIEELLMGIEPLVLTIPGVSAGDRGPDRRRGGRREPFPQRRRARQLRGPELVGEPVRAVPDSGGGRIRTKQGDPYLRRAVWLAANRARQHDPALKAFYDKKRAEGKRHRVAVTAVARKLCHIVYAVMRDQVPYDPNR